MWTPCSPPGLRLRAYLDYGSWLAGEPAVLVTGTTRTVRTAAASGRHLEVHVPRAGWGAEPDDIEPPGGALAATMRQRLVR
jgi:hypothetical protein